MTEQIKSALRGDPGAAAACTAALIESQQAQIAQQQSNEPLTLDELRKMYDEPIYIKHLCGKWHWDGWHILENCEEELIMHDGSILIDENYGKTWFAYRRKLERGKTMANCRYCSTECPEQGEHDRFFDCAVYTGRKPTNADRIRGMSDEELAAWILRLVDCDKENMMCNPAEYKHSSKCDGRCLHGRLDWLRKPVEEGNVDA